MSDADNREGYACVRAEYMEISLPSSQFCFEP